MLLELPQNSQENTCDQQYNTLFALKSLTLQLNTALGGTVAAYESLWIPFLIAAISFIIFWDFSMYYQIFLSPQMKRWAVITYKHGINELLHELPNDLILRRLGNIGKLSKSHRMIAQCPVPPPKWKLCNY